MRDYQLQKPQKDHSIANRRSKSISDHHKKSQKISKKSLNSESSAVSEDVSVFDVPKDLIDFTSISENSDENLLGESAETTSLASEVVALSELTPLSSIITSDEHKEGVASSQYRYRKSETAKLSSIEAELVVKHLREAQIQILNAANMDLQCKRFLDALVNLVVEGFIQLPEEKDWFNGLMLRKAYLVVLSFFLWILLVFAVIFFFSRSQLSFSGATAT